MQTEVFPVGHPVNPQATNYDDPSSKVWSVYVAEADAHDKTLVEGWKADMDGILIYVRYLNF